MAIISHKGVFFMTKKRIISLIAGYTALIIAVLSGFLYKSYTEAAVYKRHVDNVYQHAFGELVASVEGLDTALQKSLYATSPSMVSSVCTEVYGRSEAAMMAMGELPFESNELEHTAAFISKVGDYAFSLSRGAALGNSYTDEDKENLLSLSKSASALSQNLTELYANINDGTITIQELNESRHEAASSEDSIVPTSLAESIKTIETEFPEVPSLIYDGPFSAHIADMNPKLLESKEEISEEEAIGIATDFFGLEEKSINITGTRNDSLPVYVLSSSGENEKIIEVTVQGGRVLNYIDTRPIETVSLSDEEAVEAAKKFLNENGYESMTPTYLYTAENTVTINFAYTQNDIICYPDLIKVRVALDDGSIVNFESLGYIMNHYEREIPEIKISAEEAKGKVANGLEILSYELSVIPTSGKNEKICHEFKCENENGQHYIIYVSTETGIEEDILILLESENGTLTL